MLRNTSLEYSSVLHLTITLWDVGKGLSSADTNVVVAELHLLV